MQCKNCSTEFEGNYCSNCGQNTNVKRIDIGSLWQELIKTFTNLEYGLFYTVKELTIRPIQTVKVFLAGQRISYFPPFKYFFLTVMFYFLLTSFSGRLQLGTVHAENLSLEENYEKFSALIDHIIQIISPSLKYFYFFILLTFAGCLKLFFSKKYNYAEQVVIQTYWIGHWFLLTSIWHILLIILQTITTTEVYRVDKLITLFIALSPIVYTFIVHYDRQNKVLSIFKTILSYLLCFFILILILSILSTCYVFLINPSMIGK